jgi:hypothetical protein
MTFFNPGASSKPLVPSFLGTKKKWHRVFFQQQNSSSLLSSLAVAVAFTVTIFLQHCIPSRPLSFPTKKILCLLDLPPLFLVCVSVTSIRYLRQMTTLHEMFFGCYVTRPHTVVEASTFSRQSTHSWGEITSLTRRLLFTPRQCEILYVDHKHIYTFRKKYYLLFNSYNQGTEVTSWGRVP